MNMRICGLVLALVATGAVSRSIAGGGDIRIGS